MGDFGREVASEPSYDVPDDGPDPFAVIDDPQLKPKHELAKAKARTIADEVAETQRISELDSGEYTDAEVVDDQTAEVLDDEQAQGEIAARQKEWQEAYEKWSALEAGDELPETLHAKLYPVTLKGGRKGALPIKELARGYMRQDDYTQKLRELYEYEAHIQARERGMWNVLGALTSGDGGVFMEMITFLQAFPTFHKAALMHGIALDADRNMTPRERQAANVARQAQAQAYAAQVEANALRNQMQQAQQQQPQQLAGGVDNTMVQHQLAQMLPRAIERMAAAGTPFVETALANRILTADWEVYCEQVRRGEAQLSTDGIQDVLTGVMQRVAEHEAGGWIPEPQPVADRQKLLPPVSRVAPQPNPPQQRTARQAGAPNYSNGNPKRARLGDINFINRNG